MPIFFKATQPDALSFSAGPTGKRVRYEVGKVAKIPKTERVDLPKLCAPGVLHASDTPAMTLVGGSWPCRLFEVSGEPIVGPADHKFGFVELRVEREVESWRALGPNGQEVAALIAWLEGDGGKEWCKRIYNAARSAAGSAARSAAAESAAWSAARSAAWSAAGYAAWYAAWSAAGYAAWYAARSAAGSAAWYAAWSAAGSAAWPAARSAAGSAAWYAAESAALALCVRDLITPEEFSLLYNSTTIADALPADSLGPWDSLKGRVLG
jgi:hypothetical protein